MTQRFDQIMQKLDDDDKTYLSKFLKIVNNSLGRKILVKMASPTSSICYKNIPSDLLGESKIRVMSMLQTMEEIGLAQSEMSHLDTGVFRTYSVTAEGRSLVENRM